MKARVGVDISEMCEPLNVRKRMGERTELGWEIENYTDLGNSKTYKGEKKLEDSFE